MKYVLSLTLLLVPGLSFAYDPVFLTPPAVDSVITVDDPVTLRAYYGTLLDFPHTFRFTLDEPQVLRLQIMEPDSRQANQVMSGIIVREVERGVAEVARLSSSDATWEDFYDMKTGDAYRLGGNYKATLEPGAYLFEVSNGDNVGKYVLVMGVTPDPRGPGFFETLKEIYQVKRFLDKPFFMVLASPYYYVPSIILLVLAGVWYERHRRYA